MIWTVTTPTLQDYPSKSKHGGHSNTKFCLASKQRCPHFRNIGTHRATHHQVVVWSKQRHSFRSNRPPTSHHGYHIPTEWMQSRGMVLCISPSFVVYIKDLNSWMCTSNSTRLFIHVILRPCDQSVSTSCTSSASPLKEYPHWNTHVYGLACSSRGDTTQAWRLRDVQPTNKTCRVEASQQYYIYGYIYIYGYSVNLWWPRCTCPLGQQ